MSNNLEVHAEHSGQQNPMSFEEHDNTIFFEFLGGTLLSYELLDRLCVDWRFSFLAGATITLAVELAKNKFGSEQA